MAPKSNKKPQKKGTRGGKTTVVIVKRSPNALVKKRGSPDRRVRPPGVERPLTPRELKFVDEWFKDFNATRAYAAAGYAASTPVIAGVNGHKLLKTSSVQAEVKRRQALIREEVKVSREWLIKTLVENVERGMQRKPVLDKEGNELGVYEWEGHVVNRAVELLGKMTGAIPDPRIKLDVAGEVKHSRAVKVDYSTMPLELRLGLLEWMESRKQAQGPKQLPNGLKELPASESVIEGTAVVTGSAADGPQPAEDLQGPDSGQPVPPG